MGLAKALCARSEADWFVFASSSARACTKSDIESLVVMRSEVRRFEYFSVGRPFSNAIEASSSSKDSRVNPESLRA